MPTRSLPRSLADLLAGFRPCFTAPTFGVFQAMVCVPVGARLWQPGGPSKLDLAGALVGLLAARYPDRQFHLAGDAAYAGKTLRGLPEQVSVTTRLRSDAALYALPGPRRQGQRGR